MTYCNFFMIFIKFQKIIQEVEKMPFVNAKITLSLDDDKKNLIQSNFTDFVAISLSKPKNLRIRT